MHTYAVNHGWRTSLHLGGHTAEEIPHFKASPQHLHAEVLDLFLNYDRFDQVFTIVREPFQRFKSEYYWQKQNHLTNLTVPDWIEYTLKEYQQDPYLYDNHIRPQADFIPACDHLNIYKLEEDGVEQAKTLLQSAAPSMSLRDHLRTITSTLLLKAGNQKTSQKLPDVEEAFSDEAELILELYAEDYETFQYPHPTT